MSVTGQERAISILATQYEGGIAVDRRLVQSGLTRVLAEEITEALQREEGYGYFADGYLTGTDYQSIKTVETDAPLRSRMGREILILRGYELGE